ncbi:MAG: c-type cytochrome [Planctomycetaceae bacterium]|nr:c-type cytochrome [Planctomycetaceae bacterium]
MATLADEPSLADELPRIPATEPADALSTFAVQHGFALELAAHEPIVADPVDACFDADGRLYVAEMHGYPYSPEPREMQPQPLGKKDACLVRRLEDLDGDGVFDRSTVFADKITWCVSVCCYDDGVFALAPPYLYYFKDTTGDGVADVRETVFTGFSRYNVQGLANNLKWGPDNRIYVAGGTTSDTELKRGDESLGMLRGRDFSFDPKTRDVRFESGGLQFGHSFDDWGNRFVCSNSNHILNVVYPARYLDRTQGVAVSGVVRSIAKEGGAAPVFRTSPTEPWRIVRTRRRAADPEYRKSLPPSELVASGFFTSAAGVTIYRGDAYPDEFRGNAFIGDVGGNLIHRKTLTPDGASFIATRADENVEFITSTDNWFRPVNFVNGPDGCLYILDMYRETIEHPASIPEDIKALLHLSSGDDRGRIYRLVPPGWKQRPWPNLAKMSSADLAQQLASTNAWQRETAQRLLFERGDASVAGDLRALLRSPSAVARVHALGALAAIGKLSFLDLSNLSRDPSPHVRVRVIQLLESCLPDGTVPSHPAAEMATDTDISVQFQLALSAGEFPGQIDAEVLSRLATHKDLDPDVQQAMLTSVGDRAPDMASDLIANMSASNDAGQLSWLSRLCELAAIGSDAGATTTVNALTAATPASDSAATTAAALAGLSRGLRTRGTTLTALASSGALSTTGGAWLEEQFQSARAAATDATAALEARTTAIALLSQDSAESLTSVAPELMSPTQPREVQVAIVRALSDQPGDAAASLLLEAWAGAAPQVRIEIIDALLRGAGRTSALIEAIEAGAVQPPEIAPDKRQALLTHPDAALRERAAKVLQAGAADRQAVIDQYTAALGNAAQAERGRAVFQKICANCHRVGNEGHAVGPELASVANKSPDDLLIALLDPGREAQPIYANYTALLTDGRVVTGLIAAETAGTITFRRAEGKEDIVLRGQIEELRSAGVSLMPVGLEKDLTPAQVADVIAFIKSIATAGK